MNEYLSTFGARLARVALAQGAEIEPPTIGSGVAAEVLELAGTVAHTSERKFAPLASFLTGIAVGRLAAAGGLASDREIAAFVGQVRKDLDASIARLPPDGG
jgi:hypothetical protein